MTDTAVVAENLAKRYLIGHQSFSDDGLRHRIEAFARAPWRWARCFTIGVRRIHDRVAAAYDGRALRVCASPTTSLSPGARERRGPPGELKIRRRVRNFGVASQPHRLMTLFANPAVRPRKSGCTERSPARHPRTGTWGRLGGSAVCRWRLSVVSHDMPFVPNSR